MDYFGIPKGRNIKIQKIIFGSYLPVLKNIGALCYMYLIYFSDYFLRQNDCITKAFFLPNQIFFRKINRCV